MARQSTDCVTMRALIEALADANDNGRGRFSWCCVSCHEGNMNHRCTTGRVAGVDRDITLCHEMWNHVKKIWGDD